MQVCVLYGSWDVCVGWIVRTVVVVVFVVAVVVPEVERGCRRSGRSRSDGNSVVDNTHHIILNN